MGAVAWGRLAIVPFPTPAHRTGRADPGIQLSDWLHRRLTTRHSEAGVRDAEVPVLHRRFRRRTGVFHALPLCAGVRGSRAHAHRRSDRQPGMSPDASHNRSSSTSRAEICPAHRPLRATGSLLAGTQQVADLRLEALHALLGRAGAQIPFPVRLEHMQAERVAKEVEAFLSTSFNDVFASLTVSPSLVITTFVHASASAARPRLRMTKSSA